MTKHFMGPMGHLAVPSYINDTLNQHGLSIRQSGDLYGLQVQNRQADLSDLVPSYIDYKDGKFDLKNLKRFVRFIHQPVRSILENKNGFEDVDEQSRFRNSVHEPLRNIMAARRVKSHLSHKISEQRQLLHRTLRFMGNGSVDLPAGADETAADEGSDHADGEQQVITDDLWRLQPEFDNPIDVRSSVPGSKINLEKGFEFPLGDLSTLDKWGNVNQAHSDLSAHVTSLLGNQDGPSASLSAKELETFVHNVIDIKNLPDLMRSADVEEQVVSHVDQVQSNIAKSMMHSDLKQQNPVSADRQLKALLRQTSCLNQVITQNFDDLKVAWEKINKSKAKRNEFDNFLKEIEIIQQQALMLEQSKDVSKDAIEQMNRQHASFLSTSALILEDLGIDIDMPSLGYTDLSVSDTFLEHRHEKILETFQAILETGPSPAQKFGAETFESLKSIFVEAFQFATETNKRLATTLGLTSLYTAYNYAQNNKDILNVLSRRQEEAQDADEANIGAEEEPEEKPNEYRAQLVINPFGDDPSEVETDVADSDHAETQDTVNTIDDPRNSIVDEEKTCHRDPLGLHCFYFGLVKEYARAPLDMLAYISDQIMADITGEGYERSASSNFIQGGRDVITPLGQVAKDANQAQVLFHMPLYNMMFGRGAKEGVGAYSAVKHMFNDMIDSVRHMHYKNPVQVWGSSLSGIAAYYGPKMAGAPPVFQEKLFIAALTTVAVGYTAGKIKALRRQHGAKFSLKQTADRIQSKAGQRAVLEALSSHAVERVETEDFIRNVTVKSKVAGLKGKFNLTSSHDNTISYALKKFDAVLDSAAQSIGVKDEFYLKHLKNKIDQATKALETIKDGTDTRKTVKNLENALADLMGAQAYHMNRHNLYQAAFNKDVSADEHKLLSRHGDMKYHRLDRADRIKRHWGTLWRGDAIDKAQSATIERAKSGVVIAANGLWDGIMRGARTIQTGYNATPKPVKVGALASSLAMIGLDVTDTKELVLGQDLAEFVGWYVNKLGSVFSAFNVGSGFGVINIPDDVLVNDAGGAFAALTAGVAAYGLKQGAAISKDSLHYAMHKDGLDWKSRYVDKITGPAKNVAKGAVLSFAAAALSCSTANDNVEGKPILSEVNVPHVRLGGDKATPVKPVALG